MHLENFMIQEQYRWQGGESVFISAPTGFGKTSYVLNCLVPDAMKDGKEVLFLSNRFLLKEQIKAKIAENQGIRVQNMDFLENVEEYDGITVKTYQNLQVQYRREPYIMCKIFRRYKYVVYDEAHYIFVDSSFNPEILFLLDFIKEYPGVNIFLSATLEGIPEFIKATKYENKMVYNSRYKITNFLTAEAFIEKYTFACCGMVNHLWYYRFDLQPKDYEVFYFRDYEELFPLINAETEEKWLVFLGNKSKIGIFSQNITANHQVLTAESKNDKAEMDAIRLMLKEEKFQDKVLLTTAVLDNGINLWDSALKNIVIDTNSRTEFLQMLGRKRMKAGEKVRLFIPKKSQRYFSGLVKLNLEPALELFRLNKEELKEKILAEREVQQNASKYFCWHEDDLIKNPAAEYLLNERKSYFEYVRRQLQEDEWFYVKEQLSWIQKEDEFDEARSLTWQKEQKGLKELEEFLKEMENRELSKEEQTKFSLEVNRRAGEKGMNIVKKGRTPKLNALNKFFSDFALPFEIKTKKGYKKGESTVWIIRRRAYDIPSDNKV